MKSHCRICGNKFSAPLLQYENMPRAAQLLPTKNTVSSDKGITLDILQCAGCGTVQLPIDPVPYYRDVIRASAFSPEMLVFRQKQFANLINKFSLQKKKVLELGCGKGDFVAVLKDQGVDAFGLEHNSESVHEATQLGRKVIQGFLSSATDTIENGPFDAFVFLNFLEHLPDPNTYLRGIHHNLSQNAVGIVEVPNFNMILEKNLYSEFISDHLFYFTKDTLTSLLQWNGFEVLECTEILDKYVLSALVRKRPQHDLNNFLAAQQKIKKSLKEFVQKYPKICIWGAGHQSFTVMSLADIAGNVRYVVDSAPFKQNCFTPATHIPIFSPNNLNADPVDAVLVIAGSYSNEIVKNILEKFENKMAIAVLRHNELEIIRPRS